MRGSLRGPRTLHNPAACRRSPRHVRLSVTYVHILDRLHARVPVCGLLQVNWGADHDNRDGSGEACRVEHRMRWLTRITSAVDDEMS